MYRIVLTDSLGGTYRCAHRYATEQQAADAARWLVRTFHWRSFEVVPAKC